MAIAVLLQVGTASAQTAPAAGPEPAAPTQATFVSTSRLQWDVVVDDQAMCSTPCSGPLFPLQFVVLRSQQTNPVLLEVGRLPPGNLIVSGKPHQQGKYAGGIVATTFGGMAVAVGITFTAVGMAKNRDGMSRAGLITGAAGLLALAGGIYLMLDAVPDFNIDRAGP